MSKKKPRLQEPEEVDPEIIAKAQAEVESVTDVQTLKEKRDEYNEKTKNLVQEKKRIDEELRANRERANEYKKQRDEYNEKLKQLREEKNKVYEKIKDFNEKLKELKQKESDSEEKEANRTKGMDLKKIKKQISFLENKINTDTLDLKEENAIIKEISELEAKKIELEGATGKTKESKNIYKEITALRSEISNYNNQIQEISQESQNCHALMLDLYKENDLMKKDFDRIRKDLTETKVIADEYHNKYLDQSKKLKVKKAIHAANPKVQKQLKKQVAEDTLKDALDKKKKGQKLNIFEARALFENAVQGDQNEQPKE